MKIDSKYVMIVSIHILTELKRHVIARKLFQTFTFLQLMLKPRALLQRMAACWRCRRVKNQNMMIRNISDLHQGDDELYAVGLEYRCNVMYIPDLSSYPFIIIHITNIVFIY